ncbi:MAG: hypothetical protein A2Z83_06015 [Omnitrophica bacterium GWA2_52_8]|nr:MAG: hypothetical protein A2Z83_06015 [Omnitrophica bacterium GWA2_52_8]
MKIAVVDTYYEFFLREFYRKHPEFGGLDYAAHRNQLMTHRFSASDAFSHYFKAAGCEAEEFIFNDNSLQWKWARENGLRVIPVPALAAKGFNVLTGMDWRFRVLREQIRRMRPDVIYIKEQSLLTDAMVGELKKHAKLMVQQVGSRLLARRKYTSIDFTVTSFPHFVEMFEKRGMKAYCQKLCFDPRVLKQIQIRPKKYGVTFVGGITFGQHRARNEMLEKAAEVFPDTGGAPAGFRWFGYSTSARHQSDRLRLANMGTAWGMDMYQALADSSVTLNIHGEIAGRFANNVRLYEASGAGTCLVTDHKENMTEILQPDKECVTYQSQAEMIEKIRFLLQHPEQCADIALAGQRRTLAEHTYAQRVAELIAWFKKHLSAGKA